MEQNLSLDSKQFLEKSIKEMLSAVDYAYCSVTRNYEEHNGHTALQMVRAEVKILQRFLESLKERE